MTPNTDNNVPRYKTLAHVPLDSCFIESTTDPGHYLHPENDAEGNLQYVLKHGTIGAAIWREKAGKSLIRQSKVANLKTIRVRKVLQPDGSEN